MSTEVWHIRMQCWAVYAGVGMGSYMLLMELVRVFHNSEFIPFLAVPPAMGLATAATRLWWQREVRLLQEQLKEQARRLLDAQKVDYDGGAPEVGKDDESS